MEATNVKYSTAINVAFYEKLAGLSKLNRGDWCNNNCYTHIGSVSIDGSGTNCTRRLMLIS
jgi:hypothetical protein